MFKRTRLKAKGSIRINRKIMYCLLAFACISIISMTLVYAALSTTLKITGTAKFKDASFGVTIEELTTGIYNWNYTGNIDGNIYYDGDAKVLKKPTIVGTSITDYKVSLSKPGDEIYLLYKITNTGSIPVVLDSFIWSDPIFSSDTGNTEDIQLMQTVFDWDYDLYRYYFEDEVGQYGDSFGEREVLCPGEMLELDIWNYFDEDSTAVPSSNITISNLNAQFNFIATDSSTCNGNPSESGSGTIE